MAWEVIPIDEYIHVVPKDDTGDHSTLLEWVGLIYMFTCKCGVRLKFEKDKTIVIHSSFDGREGVEWAAEILAT